MGKKRPTRGRPQEGQITNSHLRALKELRDFIAHRKYPSTMAELGDVLGVTAAMAQVIYQVEHMPC